MSATSYAVVFADEGGATHFRDATVDMEPAVYIPGIPLVDVAEPMDVHRLQFARLDVGYQSDPHPAPRRQFVLVLTGQMELTVSDGEVRSFGPGSVFLVEDLDGAGHSTRAVPPSDCLFLTVAASSSER